MNELARPRADDPRARDLRRVRGDLEGADDAAHAADVGHERDPRDRLGRRDAIVGTRGLDDRAGPRLRRGRLRRRSNVVGGFVVTDRMLEMFKQRRPDEPDGE